MERKNYNSGDIVTPEFLNAVQDLSYAKNVDEIGHLPLPPGYDSHKQVMTIRAIGETNAIDLGSWSYNAIVIVEPEITPGAGGGTEYPASLNIDMPHNSGLVIVKPELESDGQMTLTATVNGTEVSSEAVIRFGEIAVVSSTDHDSSRGATVEIKVLQTGSNLKKSKVESDSFILSVGESQKVKIRFSNGKMIIEPASTGSASSVDFAMPIISALFTGDVKGNLVGTVTSGTANENTVFTQNLISRRKNNVATTDISFSDAGVGISNRLSMDRPNIASQRIVRSNTSVDLSQLQGVTPKIGDIVFILNTADSSISVKMATRVSSGGTESKYVSVYKKCAMQFICIAEYENPFDPTATAHEWAPLGNATVTWSTDD